MSECIGEGCTHESHRAEVQAVNEAIDQVVRREATTADIHVARFYHKILRSKRYAPSVLDMIRTAPSSEVLDKIVEHEWAEASASTRRKWAKTAEARYAVLEGEKRNHRVCVKQVG